MSHTATLLRTRITRLSEQITHLECLAHIDGMERYGNRIMVLEAQRERLTERLASEVAR